RRQHVDARNKFGNKRGKKEWMKTQYQGQQNHYEDIDCFIHNDPANGAKKKLNTVRNHSHRVRQPDSAAVQFRFENCWHNTRCSIAFCLSATETPGPA